MSGKILKAGVVVQAAKDHAAELEGVILLNEAELAAAAYKAKAQLQRTIDIHKAIRCRNSPLLHLPHFIRISPTSISVQSKVVMASVIFVSDYQPPVAGQSIHPLVM
jgi:hypothetical protein